MAAIAREAGLGFYGGIAALPGGNLEQAARRVRRSFFAERVQSGAGVPSEIALGHTRDDQAETVLFRMLRGSGLAGLAGILPVTAEGLIRPLLGVTRRCGGDVPCANAASPGRGEAQATSSRGFTPRSASCSRLAAAPASG